MWSEDIAKDLVEKGYESKDKLTISLATYLDDALNTIDYLKQQIREMIKGENNANK